MKKIVIVVDNTIIALEIKKDLESEGYLVPLICRTLKEVLNMADGMDLIIFDLDFISTKKIREVNVPVIFLSSLEMDELQSNEISSLEITFDFLYKPFTKEELLQKTSQILSLNNKYS